MSKDGNFHISEDGKVRPCTAQTPDACTAKGFRGVGKAEHFTDYAEARRRSEELLEDEHGAFGTMSKLEDRSKNHDEDEEETHFINREEAEAIISRRLSAQRAAALNLGTGIHAGDGEGTHYDTYEEAMAEFEKNFAETNLRKTGRTKISKKEVKKLLKESYVSGEVSPGFTTPPEEELDRLSKKIMETGEVGEDGNLSVSSDALAEGLKEAHDLNYDPF